MSLQLTKETIEQLLLEAIQGTDLFIVEVAISNSFVIQISVDSPKGVAIDSCISISRYIESKLDREQQDFELTVMSAGLSEPFKVYKQYVKNEGRQVSVLTTDGKKYIGTLYKVCESGIIIQYEEIVKTGPKGKKKPVQCEKELSFSDIKKTLLEITFKK